MPRLIAEGITPNISDKEGDNLKIYTSFHEQFQAQA
jgi:hypothetical protein